MRVAVLDWGYSFGVWEVVSLTADSLLVQSTAKLWFHSFPSTQSFQLDISPHTSYINTHSSLLLLNINKPPGHMLKTSKMKRKDWDEKLSKTDLRGTEIIQGGKKGCIPETNIIVYVNYILFKKEKRLFSDNESDLTGI